MKKFILAICVFLFACSPQTSQQGTFYVFGTTVEVTLPDASKREALILFAEVQKQLNHMHKRWHAWEESELTEINQACTTGKPIKVTPETKELILAGQMYEKQSQGYFNPAMGNLFSTWGFLSDKHHEPRAKPQRQNVKAVVSTPASMQDIKITGDTLQCSNPNVRLDFGGYAKGYANGQIMDYLRSQGVKNALINAGGDIQTLGTNKGQAWQIAVEQPGSKEPLAVIHVSGDESVVTSGTYARSLSDDFHHLINPKTGYPAKDFVSVTVVDSDPMRADAAATALLIAELKDWEKIAQNMNIKAVLLVTKQGDVIVTPAMSQYLD